VEEIMFRAVWNGAVLAESGHTVKVEGNHYFPPESLDRQYLTASQTTSTCPWKGQARYYHVRAGGTTNRDAAWYYPDPSPAASKIAGTSRSGTACGSSASPARAGRPGTARAAAWPAGLPGGCTGWRRDGDHDRGTRRRAGVLAARLSLLRDAAAGAAQRAGAR
jgi:hypothetical protein